MTASSGVERPIRTVGGQTLRTILAVAVLALVVLSLVDGTGISALTVLGLALIGLGVATVVRPGSVGPTMLLLVALAGHLLVAGPDLGPRVGLLAAAILLVHQLSGVCAGVPLSSTVDLLALRPMAVRYLSCVLVVEAGIALGATLG